MTRQLALAAVLLSTTVACTTSNPTVPRLTSAASVETPVIKHDGSAASATKPPTNKTGGNTSESNKSEANRAAEAAQAEAELAKNPVVARIGGEEIYLSELLNNWMIADSQGLRELLENLAVERIIMQEAERIHLNIEATVITDEYTRALVEIENGLRAKQPGVSLDEWIQGSLGLDPQRYREGLRADVKRRLYAERIVRHFVLNQEWADVRVIVLENRADAEAALVRLKAGEPFARIAAEASIDPSGKTGGRIPPVVRNNSALARLAFGTPVGDFGGPIEEGKKWIVLETRAQNPPLKGDWTAIGAEVEKNLEERPVEELEFMLWKAEMGERKPRDFEPLFEIIRAKKPN